ncbi:ATP-binding protein [Thermomonas sp.]|uniref:hybrid sensor histidine kinase/response regulator n=1 Tax=Thermomonas sp. TaxID=1971895 RepID=UPI003783205E
MLLDPSKAGIRHQLLGLFGLFLITGALVLLLDQSGQYFMQRSMTAMQDDVLTGMHRIRKLSNAYEQGLIDTTFRTRNYLINWQQAESAINQAKANSETQWQALQAMPLDSEAAALLTQAQLERPQADAAFEKLQTILHQQDILALGQFADHDLFPAADPLVQRLERLDSLVQARAAALVAAEQARAQWLGRVRVAVLGRRILRNGYRGVESLTELARAMTLNDYTMQPRYMPRGELGEVMDSFLGMRNHVRRIEAQLIEQLGNTERVRIALERREQFQRLLLEAAPTAIFAVDEDGVFSQINPFAERLLGWPAGSLLGRETLDVVLDPDALGALARSLSEAYGKTIPANWTALHELARHREPPREFALRHQRGRTLPVLLALSAMRDDTGTMVGLLAVATDLTMQKRLERALRDSEMRARDANHAKSAFLAAMSHEIRTPMIGITGMIEVLGHTHLDTEQRRSLRVISSSAESLLRIIGDILDFSKIEAGKMELEPLPTSLPDLLNSVAANYSGTASSKGLLLLCEIDPTIAPAHYVDPVRLRQVLSNFLSNALKFTERGRITIAAECAGHEPKAGAMGSDAIVFRVTDTGIGISQQAQARLFQPFAQAEADTTRRFGGTGLGLAICRRIAELMGGTITMESALGKGTSMRLQVSLQRAPADELPDVILPGKQVAGFAPRKLPSVSIAEQERSLVLLVDDHATNRQVIQRQLALAGYASEVAEDGVQGLDAWRTGRYALVLSDVHMPHMDGYQMARQIRSEESQRGLPRTPVIALTASALKGEAERCLEAGMDDYLAKPVGIATLGVCLQRWLPHTRGDADASHADSLRIQTENNTQASTASNIADTNILDRSILTELTGGDPAEAGALLTDFLASTDADLAELDRLHTANNLPELTRQAHKIKGAARLVGAHHLGEAAAALETAGRSGHWDAVATLTDRLHDAVAQLQAYTRHAG